jgi:rod shape-determining protein MreB
MIIQLLSKIFKNTIYIKFSSEKIQLRYVEKMEVLNDEPIIAIKNNGKRKIVAAVGAASRKEQSKDPSNVTLHNAFKHPRTFVSNFEIAEATLRYFICKLVQRKMFVTPLVIFHPTENIEGGVTQIERRGLEELGASIGARKTYVWIGKTLTDNELLDEKFLKQAEDRNK